MTTLARRQFDDVFVKIATGHASASVGAVANGAQGTVTITVPGVATDGTWEVLAVTANAALGAVVASGMITGANTVTVYITNNSGGSVTPPANTTYTAICGQIDNKYTQL